MSPTDHLLTLQQSLAHYERMLSQSHPTYIQNLNVDFLQARANGDHAAFALAVVTMMMLPPLVPIGMSNSFFNPHYKSTKS
jgi:magnesium transporter